MFLEKAIYSSQAKSNTKNQHTRPTVALIVEAGKLISNSISNNTKT